MEYNLTWCSLGINNSINFNTGMTPYKLIFGSDQLRHSDLDNVTPEVNKSLDSQIAK